MSLSLERMRYLTRKGLGGLSDSELTDEDCDELLNMSLWEIEDKYPFESKETSFSTTLITNQFEYSVSDADLGSILDSLQSIAILNSDGKRSKLARMTRDWLDENFDEEETGMPTRFLREGNTFTIYPIPGTDESGYFLEIMVKEGIQSLVEGTKETTGLPRNWDELCVKGAIWRGHFYHEDYNLARQALNFQVSKIKETVPTVAKEEADTHTGGLEILWDWPE